MSRYSVGRDTRTIEPGTILGPNTMNEYVVALDTDGQPGTRLGLATVPELEAARHRDEPWSVAEAKMRPVRGGIRS